MNLAFNAATSTLVNDLHSGLNPTYVDEVWNIDSLSAIRQAVQLSDRDRKAISVCSGRHAMGGQQFGTGSRLLDMSDFKQVLSFDGSAGTITVESGICWPDLMSYLRQVQAGQNQQWGIVQKQTGADKLSLGGALAANVHGRGLRFKPIIQDVEAFTLMDAEGNLRTCSRTQNPELFKLVIGGYGLFGVVTSVQLRLRLRHQVMREVEILQIDQVVDAFERRIAEGCLYGDFQFSIDESSGDFLNCGVFSTYRPVKESIIPQVQRQLSNKDWSELVYLAHSNRKLAFEKYAAHYLATHGQVYWSDTHQLSTYNDHYHRDLDLKLASPHSGSEVITEVYVPRRQLADFMREAAIYLRTEGPEVIYGTVRLIERDDETFLPWAKDAYACVIFNLHTEHSRQGLDKSARAFRQLIDLASERQGSYYLTYHKYATPQQLLRCYPQFPEFLRLKKKYDPQERFQSNWYAGVRDLA